MIKFKKEGQILSLNQLHVYSVTDLIFQDRTISVSFATNNIYANNARKRVS